MVTKFPRQQIDLQEKQKSYTDLAIRYIEANYSQSINISSIADALRIERTYLYRLFKERTGMSPKDFLITYRLKRSCSLLTETTQPIKVIALSVGYEDALYFSRLFKHTYHCTPTHYRQSHQLTISS